MGSYLGKWDSIDKFNINLLFLYKDKKQDGDGRDREGTERKNAVERYIISSFKNEHILTYHKSKIMLVSYYLVFIQE